MGLEASSKPLKPESTGKAYKSLDTAEIVPTDYATRIPLASATGGLMVKNKYLIRGFEATTFFLDDF